MHVAHPNLAAVLGDIAEHHIDVVVTLRNLLACLRAARRVADQEHLHLLAFAFRQSAGEP
jgi:hypothetical protein